MSLATPSAQIERLFHPRYQIASIARSGRLLVAQATNRETGRDVVLQTPDPNQPGAEERSRALTKEGALRSELRHPNIARLHDMGTSPVGLCYIELEAFKPLTLARPPIPTPWLTRWALSPFLAIQHLLELRIVGFFPSPETFGVTPEGRLVLASLADADALANFEMTRPAPLDATSSVVSIAPGLHHLQAATRIATWRAARVLHWLLTGQDSDAPGEKVPGPLGALLRASGDEDRSSFAKAFEAVREALQADSLRTKKGRVIELFGLEWENPDTTMRRLIDARSNPRRFASYVKDIIRISESTDDHKRAAGLYLLLARAARQNNDVRGVAVYYNRSLDYFPHLAGVFEGLVRHYVEHQQWGELGAAYSAMIRRVERGSANQGISTLILDAKVRQLRIEAAEHAVQRLGDAALAVTHLNALRGLSSEPPAVLRRVIEVYLSVNALSAARLLVLDLAKTEQRATPESIGVFAHFLEACLRCRETGPEILAAYLKLLEVALEERCEPTLALLEYGLAFVTEPLAAVEWHLRCAELALKLDGQDSKVVRHLEKVLDLEPGNVHARGQMARLRRE